MKKETWKKYVPYIAALLIFVTIAMAFGYPVLEGKVLQGDDLVNTRGWGGELAQYGVESFWTNSMFCGIPIYQFGIEQPSSKWLNPLETIYQLGFESTIGCIIIYLFGFFIFLRSYRVNKWMSIIGAIAITFSSYFFIIIGAGHFNKVYGIAYVMPILAGFNFLLQKRYGWGITLTLLFSAIGLMTHPQMTYYLFMFLGVMAIAELYKHIKEKTWKDYIIGVAIFGICLGIGIGTGYGKMKSNNEYVKETMRGGHSELAKDNDTQNKTKGLDLDYATAWSYGIDETLTLLIPNFKGGSSHYHLGTDSKVFEVLKEKGVPNRDAEDFCRSVPTYWGAQPFTSGPVYVGAIICFLFVLGLLIVKGPYKWGLLVATILSILLAWGKNFMPFTELFFNYFPMYDKFRTVSSILVVAEITMPLLGFFALKAIVDKTVAKEKVIKSIYIAAGITAGISLFFALFGGLLYNFSATSDEQIFSQIPEWLQNAILAERVSMLRSDSFRSFVFILLGASVLWLYVKEKMKYSYFLVALGFLILVDLWPVDKRYFSDDKYATPKEDKNYGKKQPYEEYILQDPDPHFRVFNLATSSFSEARTSLYLKSIGGYHPAKLRRYQDLIDQHISKINMGVLNMLNTKYFIVKENNGEIIPQRNPDAMGNCWFVDSVVVVNTPNEESDALNTINIKNTAVLDKKFESFVKDFVPGHDSTATISLKSYLTSTIEYTSKSAVPSIAVFSEVYYPYGWNAYIDGKPVEHFRVNYTLRALPIPAGEHVIKFDFHPDSIYIGEKISTAFIFLMYGIIATIIIVSVVKNRKKEKKKIE
ncbi:MAG: YfhO family protein [Bacteroidales bacterium]